MPKKIPLSPDLLAWLRDAVARNVAIDAIADRIGCCVDTAKRILVRQGLATYPGAKYQLARDSDVQMWTRPCSRCKTSRPRPKWQFYCSPCQVAIGMSDAEPDSDITPSLTGPHAQVAQAERR